jgi:hypothetical protein
LDALPCNRTVLQPLTMVGCADSCLGLGWAMCSEGRDACSKHYRQGRLVQWKGFSSASPKRRVALNFAGRGGVLLRVFLLSQGSKGRDINLLSAVASEDEVFSAHNMVLASDGKNYKTAIIRLYAMDLYSLKSAPQVLLLPNFSMIVTYGLRKVDGYDTIDLLESIAVCVCLSVCRCTYGCSSWFVLKSV